MQAEMPRREAMAAIVFGGALSWLPGLANSAGLPPGPPSPKLCDADCEKELENVSCSAAGFAFSITLNLIIGWKSPFAKNAILPVVALGRLP